MPKKKKRKVRIKKMTHLISSGGQVEHFCGFGAAVVKVTGGRTQVKTFALHPEPEFGHFAAGRFGRRRRRVFVVLLDGFQQIDDPGVFARRDGLRLGGIAVCGHNPRRVVVEHDLSGRSHG